MRQYISDQKRGFVRQFHTGLGVFMTSLLGTVGMVLPQRPEFKLKFCVKFLQLKNETQGLSSQVTGKHRVLLPEL